jgi:hypothetical protein
MRRLRGVIDRPRYKVKSESGARQRAMHDGFYLSKRKGKFKLIDQLNSGRIVMENAPLEEVLRFLNRPPGKQSD